MFFSRQRHARALPQELHVLPQFLIGFGALDLYKKVSDRRIIIYDVIFNMGFR